MLSATRSRLPLCRRAAFSIQYQARFPRRYESSKSGPKLPAAYDKDLADDHDGPLYTNFADNAVFTFGVLRRFVKFTLIGFASVGVLTWTAFEGAHQYVEAVCLANESDPDVNKWGWDRDGGDTWRWSGGDAGGTDPRLGFKGRHAVRSAWMAQHWGIGSAGSVIGSKAFSAHPGGGRLSIVEARLEVAQEFLSLALTIARERAGRVHPDTLPTLLARHAGILERMGTRDALFEARAEFEQVWDALGGSGADADAARLALKLGDLNKRLGDTDDALDWWARAIQLAAPSPSPPELPLTPTVPASLPPSPLAQRTLAQTLVSLSAFYATSGRLADALSLESASLSLLSPFLSPAPPSDPAPQALHTLYLQHRTALLAIHRAEVAYALRAAPPAASLAADLQRAAQLAERVALALTGAPAVHPDAPLSAIPHPPVAEGERALVGAYARSQSMSRPARALLRDARRAAAEAWNLAGVLYEGQGAGKEGGKKGWLGGGREREESARDVERALECYERALGWAGVHADRVGNVAEPAEAMLEAEWRVLWGNYVRAREVVRNAKAQEKEKAK
ncbi:hypothetical protein GLOTRDRAFT_91636 [Gloeophyllum trabeum ATCC 11539]|uniref:TPR-like protein n=1 Tax=Gloeophyllum trabeum (strain ATCC 11539 / FP-39264 / Madison 617) TaxID=670483 RepID=S7QE93_GLOTA|nr:uncharacterized protein GLOTRDRAFT_91636 [Gloeophyllum trabeum ATCC 11539]EPQ58126.1 hypothetical protein GLOTRDRAFT_91636 [Gloeophyllum trabeum ATCC 11539]